MKKKKSVKSVPFVTHCGHYASETYMRMFLYVTEAGLRSIIKEKKIRISCPWRTNDITEGVARGELTQDERIRAFGYVCFSAVCDSPSMWGYYAGRGEGACLVFDFPVCQRNEEDNEGKDDFFILKHGMLSPTAKMLHRIRYKKNRFPSSPHYVNHNLLLTKSPDWQHEHEYRILYRLDEVEDALSYTESPTQRTEYYDAELLEYVSGIILGPKCKLNVQEVKTEISRSYASEGGEKKRTGEKSFAQLSWEMYLGGLGMKNASVIPAKLDLMTFAYSVPIERIKVNKHSYVHDVVFNLMNCDRWTRSLVVEGEEYAEHYSWLLTDEYEMLNRVAFGDFSSAGFAKCKDALNHSEERMGIYLVSHGERYVIPYVHPQILKHIQEKAEKGVINKTEWQ